LPRTGDPDAVHTKLGVAISLPGVAVRDAIGAGRFLADHLYAGFCIWRGANFCLGSAIAIPGHKHTLEYGVAYDLSCKVI
jgi:hypothetical protein